MSQFYRTPFIDSLLVMSITWTLLPVASVTLYWGAVCIRSGQNFPHQCRHCQIPLLTHEDASFCCGPDGSQLNDVPALPSLPDEYNVFLTNPLVSKRSCHLNLIFSFAFMETTAEFTHLADDQGFFAVQGKVYHHIQPNHHNSAVRWLVFDGFKLEHSPFLDLAASMPAQ